VIGSPPETEEILAEQIDAASLVAELRQRLDLSQEKLATLLKVSLPTVQRWERRKASPDPRAVHLIEQFLDKLGSRFADLKVRYFSGQEKLPLAATEAPAGRSRGRRKAGALTTGEQSAREMGPLDTKEMEGLLWRAACSIRGEKDAPKFKDYILPLVFIKRLSDVFDDEVTRLAETLGGEETAKEMVEADHSLVRFYIPEEARWGVVSGRGSFEWPPEHHPRTLGEQVTMTMRSIAKANPSLQGVIDVRDYNETRNGEREISDDALKRLVNILSAPRYRLGLKNVEPDFLGRTYEYLLRKFAEGQGQSAGEFFTPKEVGWLIAKLVHPKQGEEIYDPCCGSGGLLVKCELELARREGKPDRPLKLFGQEQNSDSFAIGRMNMVLHDMEGEIVRGDTMKNPKFLEAGHLQRFDVVVTNPMWNQKTFDLATYEQDPLDRFATTGGFAPPSSADWAWLQHVVASLRENGRAAVVLDTGAGSRGSGNEGDNKEKAIRRWFVERDLVEAVILLPDNLFYNTPAAGLIFLLNRHKPKERAGRILFVNGSGVFEKGRPKNFIPDEGVERIVQAVRAGQDVEGLLKGVAINDLADFNLSPSRYVASATVAEHRDIQVILDELASLEAETTRLDAELREIFAGLGYRWGGHGEHEAVRSEITDCDLKRKGSG
jgi:type I restriction enzyme M protein